MQTIQAIETRWKGFRFRSRLEARWAVFFENIGVQWDYEKEGFNLGDAGYYLPDFWIDDWKCWVEIKPLMVEQLEEDYEFVPQLLELSKQNRVLLIMGRPWVGNHKIYDFHNGRYEFDFNYDCFSQCRRCSSSVLLSVNGFSTLDHWKNPGCESEKWPVDDCYSYAYVAARSARFEHGETP
jgi:hypothetical protein